MDFSKTVLGIEFGSTRIKATLIDENHTPIASGDYGWENRYADGIWTYSMSDIHNGLRTCYANLKKDVFKKYGEEPETFGAIGVSGMMHGYLPFDKDGGQLADFRTWRNTMTGEAAEKLTAQFRFNIPQRWSVAHLYQAMLNGEEHLRELAYMTTLAGYIHWRLTGEKVVGIGEASGIFPIDSRTRDYNQTMVEQFDKLTAPYGYAWRLLDVLPKALPAGKNAGTLTADGARFLDPEGVLKAGIPVAPCEGDAGTGMTATNSIRPRTGNVSAGTSDFAMVVVDRLPGVHREIDMVTTPDGLPVAMVHCNNCTSDMNAWVSLFGEFAGTLGVTMEKGELFTRLFQKALEGEADCGGLLSYNYFSGEGVTGFDEGRPLFARTPDARFTLANFMRAHLLSALATLKIGLDILTREENVRIERLYGHGGFFKTPQVGQRLLSAAVNAPVSVMETAGEGGPYGMALLAAYMLRRKEGESLADYLDKRAFANAKTSALMADTSDVEGFSAFLERYKKALPVERAAVETM
ncbi:MAG: FGGY-family carbohydrate kinase [Oscillibacter sp.]|nr:FGGY-family carbohydrate kinase [Oscillibacter sp.]